MLEEKEGGSVDLEVVLANEEAMEEKTTVVVCCCTHQPQWLLLEPADQDWIHHRRCCVPFADDARRTMLLTAAPWGSGAQLRSQSLHLYFFFLISCTVYSRIIVLDF